MQFPLHGLRGSLCSMEMQVPPEQAPRTCIWPSPDSHFPWFVCRVTRTPSTCVLHVFVALLLCFGCKDLLFLPALDAPSSGVCSAVASQDRLPCAPLPISQGDCEVRGCCYDPRDRAKPCYFGNTGKPEQLCSLPPELLQNQIPHFAGRASLLCTTPTGGSGLCFCLPRI